MIQKGFVAFLEDGLAPRPLLPLRLWCSVNYFLIACACALLILTPTIVWIRKLPFISWWTSKMPGLFPSYILFSWFVFNISTQYTCRWRQFFLNVRRPSPSILHSFAYQLCPIFININTLPPSLSRSHLWTQSLLKFFTNMHETTAGSSTLCVSWLHWDIYNILSHSVL